MTRRTSSPWPALLLLFTIAAGVVVACGGSDPPEPQASEPDSGADAPSSHTPG